MKRIPEEPMEQSDALFLARVAAEEQNRFARRLIAGLSAFFLVWLAALLYFKQPVLRSWLPPLQSEGKQPLPSPEATLQMEQVDRLNRELVRLQQQLGSALTQNLSVKLGELEQRIRLGRAGLQDLELIESIREDIQTLAGQNKPRFPGTVVSSGLRQDVLASPLSPRAGEATNADLLGKISRLENLLYFSLASMLLVTVAAAGLWLRSGSRMRRLDAEMARLRYQLQHQKD